MIAINYHRLNKIRELLDKLPKTHSENTLSYYDSIVGHSDSDVFHIRKPAKGKDDKLAGKDIIALPFTEMIAHLEKEVERILQQEQGNK